MKWAQFINNYKKSTLERPMTKQFSFAVLFFFIYYLGKTNIMIEKGFSRFGECAARCVHMSHQEEECTSSSWGDSEMYLTGSIADS